jgi:hypothetical protein
LGRITFINYLGATDMKAFEHGKWHAWEGTVGILLSDEDEKKLRQFKTADDCINWLFLDKNGDKDAARALNQHIKGV